MVREVDVQPKHPVLSPHWTHIWVLIIKKTVGISLPYSFKKMKWIWCVLIEKDDNLMWLKLLKGKYPVDIISSKPM
jgi:hypothetical protein